MCTLTWWREEDSYGVFFNRDEKKDRPVAESPAHFDHERVNFLAPRDPRGGGTWMLVNEHGVIVCLLNKWHLASNAPKAATKSRGQLVLAFASLKEISQAPALLKKLEDYPPFSLFLMEAEKEALWEWDGATLAESRAEMPLTSSSFSFEEVKAARLKRFKEGERGAAYHASSEEEASAYTVRMCRPDAQTWSRSMVTVGARIHWEYLAEQPDLLGEPERTVVNLPRC